MNLTLDEAIGILRRLQKQQQEFCKGVDRKRWRPSEKTLAKVHYESQYHALEMALVVLSAEKEKNVS